MNFFLNKEINGYKFLELIGQGAFSDVYRVTSLKYSLDFAAKVMNFKDHNFESLISTFESEFNVLCRLDHPNIIKLYDKFMFNGLLVLILEYCPGGTLNDEIKKNGKIDEKRFLFIMHQVTDAILYSHSKNIIHHDIKPHNILFDKNGRPKIADFGLSILISSNLNLNTFHGTPAFLSPEVILKKPYDNFKVDVWALGVTFYYSLTGFLPYIWEDLNDFQRKLVLGLPKNNIKPEFFKIIKEMLNLSPSQRLSIEEILQKLKNILSTKFLSLNSSSKILNNNNTSLDLKIRKSRISNPVLNENKPNTLLTHQKLLRFYSGPRNSDLPYLTFPMVKTEN